MIDNEHLNQVKQKIKDILKESNIPNTDIRGFGITSNTVVVYVAKKTKKLVRDILGDSIDGVDISIEVISKIIAQDDN